jgi:hypothetical protein
MFFRKITYAFKPSVAIPGARGLFRTVAGSSHGTEELVAPFDTSARFEYYLNDGTKVNAAHDAMLRQVRGIELHLVGESENPVPGSAAKKAPLTTAIFFKNRPLH